MEPVTDPRALMELARIALTFYRRDMDSAESRLGHGADCQRRTYPFGMDVERDLRAYLGEPNIAESDTNNARFLAGVVDFSGSQVSR